VRDVFVSTRGQSPRCALAFRPDLVYCGPSSQA